MNDARTLTLIVADQAATPAPSDAKEEDFEEEAIPAAVARLLGHRPKDVPLDKLTKSLDRAQAQIDELLEGVKQSTVAGFRLNSIEVSLAISAEGSIGVATAGVEASMALSFERVSAA
jgi:hypothetical protein